MTKRALLLALLVVTVALPIVGAPAAAAPQSQQASLAIDQPHYIDGEVTATQQNGTRVYHVSGSPIEISATNFDADDVVAYGVLTDGGDAQLSYESQFQQFVFTADAEGTYTVYWTVERQLTVENASDNGTHTETRQYRYEARIRVDGKIAMSHQPKGSLQAMEEKATRWENFNATIQPLRTSGLFTKLGLKEPPTTEEFINGMIAAWKSIHAPLAFLTGGYTTIVTMVAFTPGGWLFVLTILLPPFAIAALIYYRYNVKESIEAEEGKLARRIGTAEWTDNLRSLANNTWNTLTEDDYFADGFRAEGRNPLQGYANRESKLRDRAVFHAILQAMAECGYVAEVERTQSDGGGDGEPMIEAARVVHKDDVDADAETMALTVDSPDHELLDAIDPQQEEILTFDLVNAEFDRTDVNPTPVDTYDLEELIETTDIDMQFFGDAKTAAKYQVKYLEEVRQHPIADDRGHIDGLRYWLEQQLDVQNVLHDRFELPVEQRKRVWERAIEEYDAGAEAEETLQDVQEGRYA